MSRLTVCRSGKEKEEEAEIHRRGSDCSNSISRRKKMKKDPSGYWESIGVKGDAPGHPFRGNQYTDGGGAGGGADEDVVSDKEKVKPVYDAIETILSDREHYNTSLNYAVNYAREALNMSGRELQVQVLYLLNNLGSWRHPQAQQVRQTLREFAKPPKRPKQRID